MPSFSPSPPLHKPQLHHPFPPTPLLLRLHLSLPTSPNSLLTFPPRPLSLSLSLHSTQIQSSSDHHVIGDCIVFEDGAFEDPYLQHDSSPSTDHDKTKTKTKTKTKSRGEPIINEGIEFGRRVEKKNVAIPLKETQEFLVYKEMKLRQLRPRVLDDPDIHLDVSGSETETETETETESGDLGGVGCSSSARAAPRNPAWRCRRKLFTKEEKFLLNKRVPNLADATSVNGSAASYLFDVNIPDDGNRMRPMPAVRVMLPRSVQYSCALIHGSAVWWTGKTFFLNLVEKWLPLHTLAASGEFYLVDALLKHNVDINAADKDGLTALHRAILCKKQAVTNYLLRESANPFVRDKEGATLMHYAVQTASIPAIKTLLLYNVDINLADDYGWTPLHLAVLTRRTDLVKLLLIKGADKTQRNKDGLTPVELCLYSGRHTRTYELVKLLKVLPKSQQPKQSVGSC
ncbi:hypothetical protein Syun_015139 [Stephania yunnanensis]|uniref:Ankyrin repeat domain-containing protein, chloroplastic n=1 Tax=Stephania yunnanensis TaxID=152371 RepID=A0AAP0JKZ7_9MAGN